MDTASSQLAAGGLLAAGGASGHVVRGVASSGGAVTSAGGDVLGAGEELSPGSVFVAGGATIPVSWGGVTEGVASGGETEVKTSLAGGLIGAGAVSWFGAVADGTVGPLEGTRAGATGVLVGAVSVCVVVEPGDCEVPQPAKVRAVNQTPFLIVCMTKSLSWAGSTTGDRGGVGAQLR